MMNEKVDKKLYNTLARIGVLDRGVNSEEVRSHRGRSNALARLGEEKLRRLLEALEELARVQVD